ncbi:MAG: hypothetical protein JWP36_1767 [Paucimonas sp.]|nr:hypothetical protein [Paucimonas sp.]
MRESQPQSLQSQQAPEALQASLEQMAARMAQALSRLDCPDCCGPHYEFIEFGAQLHGEEMEWACVVHVLRRRSPGA